MRYGPGNPFALSPAVTVWQLFALFVLSAVAFLAMVDPAFAQAAGGGGSFSCSNGQAVGALYDSGGGCPTTLGFDNVFSFLVCNIEHLSSNLMGRMFCGMIYNLTPAVSAVLVFATAIFGIGFTIGVIPATARDLQVFLLKVSFVWVFATQSDYLIDYGYGFLMNGIRDGVAVALSSYNPSGDTGSGSAVYAQLDAFLAQLIKFATDYIGAGNTGNGGDCKNALFAVMAVMAVAFPPIFFLALALLMKIAITFVRAVFGYIYALVGITFLLTLAPFFLSFYLFRQTRSFFDKWLGYLASFALQIVILFAFLSFILAIDVSRISESFTGLIVKVQETKESTSFRAPWEYCTLCDFEVVDTSGNVIPPEKQADFLGEGKLRCTSPTKPITILSGVAPEDGNAPNQQQQSVLLKFAGGGFMALLVLAYIVEALLGSVASLAQVLSGGMGGATFAPQLGGGQSIGGRPVTRMPGDGLYTDFETGMTRGFGAGSGGSSVGAFTRGFKEGARNMIEGNRGERGGVGHTGAKNRFLDWLSDPNHIDGY